jgi:hypothetical protein
MKDTQLLCTFTVSTEYKTLVEHVKTFYTLSNNKIFVFNNEKNDNELYLTYNIIYTDTSSKKLPNTISIHRKKQTNTLYTLNAMNRLITEENNGTFDKTFQLNWEYYKNSLIITNEVSVKIIGLKIFDIIS